MHKQETSAISPVVRSLRFQAQDFILFLFGDVDERQHQQTVSVSSTI
jgi:hypothetical protein